MDSGWAQGAAVGFDGSDEAGFPEGPAVWRGCVMGREMLLIGIGAGDPGWLTFEAAEAIRALDVVFVVLKESDKDDLVDFRRDLLRRHRDDAPVTVELVDPPRPWQSAPDYDAAVAQWREQRLTQWADAVQDSLGEGRTGGFLVWGDPGLYESTLAIVTDLAERIPDPPTVRVIPGISCVAALSARHRIPLNRQGHAVQISPARLLADGMPADVDDVVVMLDGRQTFASIDPTGLDIYWGAYLGTPQEILIAGALEEVRDEIAQVRAEAKASRGWMFDTYLLRRHTPAAR